MQSLPTQTAIGIFANVRSRSSKAIFLCKQDHGPVLSFGANRTRAVRYLLHLHWAGSEIERRTDDRQPFALLLDRGGPKGTLRLVLYDGANPQPVVDYDGKDGSLSGQILIQAHAEQGDGEAVLHAIFAASGESSLMIDSDQELTRHLTLAASMLEGGAIDGVF